MELTRKDRWILSNQLQILASLYPQEAEGFDHAREALERGYELEYAWCVEHIYEKTLSAEECNVVLDSLEMHTQLERAYEAMEDKQGVEDWEVEFPGWDGNNEGPYMSYARHFCQGQNKFTAIGERAWMNSHSPTLRRKRAMLAAWNEVKAQNAKANRYELSANDVLTITKAWRDLRDGLDAQYAAHRQ